MTNADLFRVVFHGLMATELWAKPESEFLEWLNAEAITENERFKIITKEQPVVILCKDCKFYDSETGICAKGIIHGYAAEWFCADAKRR